MGHIFVKIYRYFRHRRSVFWIVFAGVCALMAAGASRVRVEEDVTRFFPDDGRVGKLSYVFRSSRFADRLVVMVSIADSATAPRPDSLIAYAEELVQGIQAKLDPLVSSVNSRIDDSKVFGMVNTIRRNLPVFLESRDYKRLDSLIRPEVVRETLENSYRQLISPSGIITKDVIANDPLGFTFLALEKLQHVQYDENIELYENYLLSKDRRHLVFFIQPRYPSNNTGKNGALVEGLEDIIAGRAAHHPEMKASFFGAASVAAGNARQLRDDTALTITLMVVLLAVFLVGYFRKKRVPFLIFIPVVFGGLFSLCCVWLAQGSISIIAIAAGSVILGIAVNYALHFLVHLKHTRDVEAVISDLVGPMTLGSMTTVLAFLCLQFVNAAVLRDLGLFAAFSLIGAALCSLIFLPQFIQPETFGGFEDSRVETESAYRFRGKKYIVWVILLLTPVFLFFAPRVSFNRDIGQLNYMDNETRAAQKRLESINRASLGSVYILSQAEDLERALRKNEQTISSLAGLRERNEIEKLSSVSAFIISDSLQAVRIAQWEHFWDDKKVKDLAAVVRKEGAALRFSEKVFQRFEDLLTRQYYPDTVMWAAFRNAFFDDYIIEEPGKATVITLANVSPAWKDNLYDQVSKGPSGAFDRQMLTNVLAGHVRADFNFIVTFTSLLVFFALLVSFGRIEITLITFLPMLITWIWILGIMAIAGIEFNIVNVMISTFIFGLGDDYSIFTMDGLQKEYKLGRKTLPSIRTSVRLSALTTISGLGVLIFADHPALKSIAAISIIGIVCVFIMSQSVEPFLFRWLITNRTEKGLPPMTFAGIAKTIFTYGFFIAGSLALTLAGLLLRAVPLKKSARRLGYHALLSFFTRSLITLAPHLKVQVQDKPPDLFSSPAVIISNHSSFLDILLMTMLHPRLILLTNRWVWNSPFFGGVVRLAEYYPVMEGAGDSIEGIAGLVRDGYSIVVFPEGKRSADGKITRFHKGAFYLAEKLRLPVQPVLIHGAAKSIPKGTFYFSQGTVTLRFLPSVQPADLQSGTTYAERTKSISRYFRDEYDKLAVTNENAYYFRHSLIANYLYKGPVLEWYTRIKLRLESFYEPFHKIVPLEARVLDLGCGYGYLPYMLSFLSAQRRITGVDYDDEKIATARACYSKNDRVEFLCADITAFKFQTYDVIIIADVLHYLQPHQQRSVIERALAALAPGGRLIIREGNADLAGRHRGTRLTEFFSVRLLRFNKSVNDELHFISGRTIEALAGEHGFAVTVLDDTKFTSNVIFVLEK